MNKIHYTEDFYNSSFSALMEKIGKWKSPSEVVLCDDHGKGSVRLFDIEDGLQIRIWDCELKHDVIIDRNSNKEAGSVTFTLVYYLTPGTFKIEDKNNNGRTLNDVWNTVFMTSDSQFSVTLCARKPLRCLSLNFTPSWLDQHILTDIRENSSEILSQLKEKSSLLIYESITSIEKQVTSQIFENRDSQSFGRFFFRSKALNLLTEFFSRLLDRDSSLHGNSFHEDQIYQAERILSSNIGHAMPDVKKLAATVALSESTLKRYFVKTFGKNIHDYFYEMKMHYAKQLLTENNKTITEIAYMLGYENLSHFSTMFKKHFGTPPSFTRDRLKLS